MPRGCPSVSAGRVEVAEWLSLSGQTAGGAGVELVGRRLIEHELWDGLGLGGIEGRSLTQEGTLPSGINTTLLIDVHDHDRDLLVPLSASPPMLGVLGA